MLAWAEFVVGMEFHEPGREVGGAVRLYLNPAPPSAEMRVAMVSWHGRFEAAMVSLKEDWSSTLWALDRVVWGSAVPACDRMRSSLETLERSEVLRVPDEVVGLYVRMMVDELGKAVAACGADRYFETRYRMELAGSHALQVVRFLEPYGLKP